MSSRGELRRQLGLGSAIALVVGQVIGVGIFLTPAGMAKSLGSPLWLLVVWLTMGATTLAGALCLGELAARYPAAGGLYVYLRQAYGPQVAFLFGWMSLLVLDPGITAVLAVGLASYVGYLVELSAGSLKAVAVGTILALAAVNAVGVRPGAGLLRWLTVFKLGLLVFLACWGFGWGLGDWSNFTPFVAQRPGSDPLAKALAAGMVAAFFSFGGWWDVTRMAGEVRDPGRTLPRALTLGVLAVTVAYVLVSVVFLYLVPLTEVTTDQTFAAQAGVALFGRAGGMIFSAVVIVAVLGSLVGVIMGAPRVYYAMARDGLFLPGLAAVHPRLGTPARAITLQAALSSALVFSGTFGQILAYVIFVAVVFLALTVAAVFVLRRQSSTPPGYRTPGFPWTPLLFLGSTTCLLVLLALDSPARTLLGVAIVALGVPVYHLAFRGARPPGFHPLEESPMSNLLKAPPALAEPISLLDKECWERMPPAVWGKGQQLPSWAKAVAVHLPRAAAAMLELDLAQRTRSPLDPVLRAKMRWVIARTNRCAYSEAYALADLSRTGSDATVVRALTSDPEGWLEGDREPLEFARLLTVAATTIADDQFARLRERFGDRQVAAMVLLAAYGNFQDRIVLGLDLPLEAGGPLPPLDVKFASGAFQATPILPPQAELPRLKSGTAVVQPDPEWSALSFEELQSRLERQRGRASRLPVPIWDEVKRHLPPELAAPPTRVVWTLVCFGYAPELAVPWTVATRTMWAESKQDRVFEESLFWVQTRAVGCNYCMGHCEMLLEVAGLAKDAVAERVRRLGGDWSCFPPAEQRAFAFARKLTWTPWELTAADYKTLEQDLGADRALFTFWWLCRGLYMTRVSDGFQLPLERDNVFGDFFSGTAVRNTPA